MLTDGHQVSQYLTGMAIIGQAVDHRDGAIFGQRLNLCLCKGTDHDAVQIAGKNTGGVTYGLTSADLQLLAA